MYAFTGFRKYLSPWQRFFKEEFHVEIFIPFIIGTLYDRICLGLSTET